MNPKTTKLLLQTQLFQGFNLEELAQLLPQLAPAERTYSKGQPLLLAGFEARDIGILLAGRAGAAKITKSGAQFTILRLAPGAVFGDVLAGSHTKSPVNITAEGDCRALLLPYARLLHLPERAAPLHRRLLANLVAEISDKYFLLNDRLDLLLQKTIRKRLAAYLLNAGGNRPSQTFTIPFTRVGLADYLGCERSALSRELSHMVGEGLIETHRQTFRLPAPERVRALL